jgi:hypothetical protein
MTKPKRETRWFVPTTAVCAVGLVALSMTPAAALASSGMGTAVPPAQVNLHIEPSAAGRILAVEEGASQEADTEKPKSMNDQAAPRAVVAKPVQPPEDKLAFLKDWPFWVIVGGVIVAGAATYMLVKNANDVPPCGARYTQGCFGAGH